jgi:L-rhamnonate dehydratase
VPLAETRLFPGSAVPVNGQLVPSGDPGFGLGATLDQLDAMRA